MPNEPTDESFVDPNTDNLDDFTDLFSGKSKPEEDVKTDVVEPVDEDDENSNKPQDSNTDEPLDGEEDSDKSEDKTKPKEKVNRFQERINELTAKAREAERALEALKTQQKNETAKQPLPVVQDSGPDPDALNDDGSDKYPLGEFDPKYIRDMARHTIAAEYAIKEQEALASRQQQEIEQVREELHQNWVSKLNPVIEQHEDFLDKTLELETTFEGLDPQYSDYLVQTIKSLDHGPDVLYYFANNLDEAQKFVKMGALHATLALGEINAMFKGQSRKPETKVSNAPPPPQVNKGSKTRVAFSADTDDLDAFSSQFFK